MHALIATLTPLHRLKLVKIDPIVFELKGLRSENCAATRPKFDDRRLFDTLAFQIFVQYRNFDFSTLLGNHYVRSL